MDNEEIDNNNDVEVTPAIQAEIEAVKAELMKKLNGRTIWEYELDLEKEEDARLAALHADPAYQALWVKSKKKTK